MSASSKLAIRPERCDRCGLCVAACPRSLVKVGGGYVYIDVSGCQSCYGCVRACTRGAIERGAHPSKPTGSRGAGAKVVVGSRAEAKAYKKAADAAEKSAAIKKRPLVPQVNAAASDAPETRVTFGGRFAAALGWDADAKPATASAASGRAGLQWTPQEVVALLIVMVAAFGFKQVALGSMAFELMPPAGQVVVRSLVLGLYYATQIGMMAFLAHRRGMSLLSAFDLSGAGSSIGAKLGTAGLCVLLLLGARTFSTSWAALMRGLGWAPPSVEGADFSALFGAGLAGLALTLVAVAVLGPIAEELFFRGALLRVLAERVGAWPAVFITALLYAGSHLEPWVFVSTFVLGIALGWLAWFRGSLRAAIVLHGIYNAVAVLAAFYVAS